MSESKADNFFKRVETMYPNRYIKSEKTKYKNCTTPVIMCCVIHQNKEVSINPSYLSKDKDGSNVYCELCKSKNAPDTDSVLADAKRFWGDTIDYSGFEYSGMNTKYEFKCIKHGKCFTQRLKNHLSGSIGCADCKKDVPKKIGTLLKQSHPELFAQIDINASKTLYRKTQLAKFNSQELKRAPNTELNIETINTGSGIRLFWICSKDPTHKWDADVKQRTGKTSETGCPYCVSRKISIEDSLAIMHPNLALEWDYEKNRNICANCKNDNCDKTSHRRLTPSTVGVRSNKMVSWKCPKGHGYVSSTNRRTVDKENCPTCKEEKQKAENGLAVRYPHLVEEWVESNGDITDFTYGSSHKVMWKCKNPKHAQFKAMILDRTLGKTNCPKCARVGFSAISIKWLETIMTAENIKIQHANNTGEFCIRDPVENRRYHVDGYHELCKTVYEFLGTYWHGDPDIYNADEVNTSAKKTFGELYEKTMIRIRAIERLGYKVIYVWERDFNLGIMKSYETGVESDIRTFSIASNNTSIQIPSLRTFLYDRNTCDNTNNFSDAVVSEFTNIDDVNFDDDLINEYVYGNDSSEKSIIHPSRILDENGDIIIHGLNTEEWFIGL